MDVHAGLVAPCAPDELFALVDDLARYPEWLDLVHRVERLGDAATSDERVWAVELRARLGPLARSKRLRMACTEHDAVHRRAAFERREADGRRHAPWTMHVAVDGAAEGSALRMHLHYGGGLWTGGVLERTLAEQITNGRERLLSLVQPTH